MKLQSCCLSILLLSTMAQLNAASPSLLGSWSAQGPSNAQHVPMHLFSIEIQQANQNILGKYCYITQSGNRIDCDNRFKGKRISPNHYQVYFDSSFGGRNGIAELRLSPSQHLIWNLIQAPQQGQYFIPQYSELSLDHAQAASFQINKSKAFIYRTPDQDTQTRSYLIHGDQVQIQNTHAQTWVEVEYKGRVLGWISAQDLDPVPIPAQ